MTDADKWKQRYEELKETFDAQVKYTQAIAAERDEFRALLAEVLAWWDDARQLTHSRPGLIERIRAAIGGK